MRCLYREQYNNDHTKTHWNQLITVYFSVFSGGFNVISPLLSDFLHKRGYLRRSHYLVACLGIIGADFVVLGIMTIIPHHHHGACHLKMAYVFMMALVGGGFGTFLTILPTLLEDIYGKEHPLGLLQQLRAGDTHSPPIVSRVVSVHRHGKLRVCHDMCSSVSGRFLTSVCVTTDASCHTCSWDPLSSQWLCQRSRLPWSLRSTATTHCTGASVGSYCSRR